MEDKSPPFPPLPQVQIKKSKLSKFSNKFLPSPTVRCILAGLVVAFASFTAGNTMGYSSPAIPNLNSQPIAPFRVSPELQSWFASVMYLAGIGGSTANVLLMDVVGRKLGLMLCAVPLVIAWVVMANACNVAMFFVGRVVTGFCKLSVVGIMIVYNAEIAPPHLRGVLVSFHETLYNLGILTCYVLGAVLSWKWLAIGCAAIAVAWTCMMTAIPETPRWLSMKGQKEEAREALVWLRGESANVDAELQEIVNGIEASRGAGGTQQILPWSDFLKPALLKPLFICIVSMAFQEFCGINTVRLYTVTIFTLAGNNMNPYYQTIVVGAVMFVSAVVCSIIVDRLERRTLAIVSGLLLAISMCSIGVFFKVKEVAPDVAQGYLSWLPLLGTLMSTLAYSAGFGPVPYILVGERFSTPARARASSLCLIFQSIFGFLTTKFFVNIRDALGEYTVFWIYTGICLLGVVYFFFTVPKTRGKSLEETQADIEMSATRL